MYTPSTPPTPDLDAAIARDVQALRERDAVRRSVAADPLPGPAAKAFAPEPLRAHGFTVRPCTAGDVILLRRIDSPLIRRTKELVEHFRQISAGELAPDTEPAPSAYADEEAVEMVYQFVRPIEEVRAALDLGRKRFTELALRTVADQLRYDQIPDLIALVEASFQSSFETAQQYAARNQEAGEVRNFSTPEGPPPTA